MWSRCIAKAYNRRRQERQERARREEQQKKEEEESGSQRRESGLQRVDEAAKAASALPRRRREEAPTPTPARRGEPAEHRAQQDPGRGRRERLLGDLESEEARPRRTTRR